MVEGAAVIHWLSTAFSTYVLHSQHGLGYQWASGPGANFGEIAIIGAAIGLYRRWNCSAPRCWRHGKHPTADGLHHLCRRHHPDLPDRRLTLAEIHLRHHRAKRGGDAPPPA